MRGRSASALRKDPRSNLSGFSRGRLESSSALRTEFLHPLVGAKLPPSEPGGPQTSNSTMLYCEVLMLKGHRYRLITGRQSKRQARMAKNAGVHVSESIFEKTLWTPQSHQFTALARRPLLPRFEIASAMRYNIADMICLPMRQHASSTAAAAAQPPDHCLPIDPFPLFSISTPTPFLIDSPKRLKIAATPRKQPSRLIPNRIKTDPPQNAFTRLSLSRLAPHFSIFPRPFSIPAAFRIVTSKRLKTAATPRKQSSRLISNRYKKGASQNASRCGSCSAGPGFVRHAFLPTVPLSRRAPNYPLSPSPLTETSHPHKLAYRRGA